MYLVPQDRGIAYTSFGSSPSAKISLSGTPTERAGFEVEAENKVRFFYFFFSFPPLLPSFPHFTALPRGANTENGLGDASVNPA
ncbi:hypothetical protein ISCGN_019354 [Ixodes scapularis]